MAEKMKNPDKALEQFAEASGISDSPYQPPNVARSAAGLIKYNLTETLAFKENFPGDIPLVVYQEGERIVIGHGSIENGMFTGHLETNSGCDELIGSLYEGVLGGISFSPLKDSNWSVQVSNGKANSIRIRARVSEFLISHGGDNPSPV